MDNAPEYGLARSGHFAVQDHGSRVWFRNMKIKELPRKPKQESLFNGKDLTGWIFMGQNCGMSRMASWYAKADLNREYGYLGTRKYYDDFDLSLEFKEGSQMATAGSSSDSYIRSGVRISGWQVELLHPDMTQEGIYESYGRGWIYQIPDEKENILKKDDWNTMRIRAEGNKVTTWLNGEVMTDLTDEKIGRGKGRIMLQIHAEAGSKSDGEICIY